MAEIINLDIYRQEKALADTVYAVEGVKLNVMAMYRDRLVFQERLRGPNLLKKAKSKKKIV